MTLISTPTLYTSRSSIETYRNCQREWYYAYYFKPEESISPIGGVVPTASNMFLETGSAVHNAIETLDKTGSNLQEAMKAASEHITKVSKAGWYGISQDNEYAQNYTTKELELLVPALVFLWGRVELPYLQSKYTILVKEKPVSKSWGKDGKKVICEFRPDAILRDKQTGDITGYSLKTLTQWGWREAIDYPIGMQVFTELYGTELFLRNTLKIKPKLKGKLPESPRGTRFCFLIKGEREKVYDQNGNFSHSIIDNPLLKGYKNIMGGDISYAHQKKYPKPENKSGYGLLGKGWEEFSIIYENSLGKTPLERLTNWIGKIESGQTIGLKQGKDVISDLVVVPDEYSANSREIEEEIQSFVVTSFEILDKTSKLSQDRQKQKWELPIFFPKTRGNCNRYGKCKFYDVCHSGANIDVLVSDGVFKSREPHHKEEKKLLERED